MKYLLVFFLVSVSCSLFAQVDTSYVYNTSKPYGTLDIRIAKSSTRYYYLQENKTVSFRESSPGVKTNTFRDMTSWDSSPYAEGNFREKNGTSDMFIMNYRLLFPSGYQAGYTEGYPMIVMMHGAGERANCWNNNCYWADRTWRPYSNNPPAPTDVDHELLNNDHNMSHGGKQHLDARNLAGTRLPDDPALSARAFPGFVLFAQNLNGWDVNATQDLIKLVRLVVKKYNVDPDRIYIHGLSNGGIAVYEAIKRAPWLFAAGLPMSAPNDASTTSAALISSVAHIPMWMFQGGKDTQPTPARTEGYVRLFRQAGAEVRYSLYENLGHGTWNTAYAEPDFFSWMRSKSKNKIHVFFGSTTLCPSSGQGVKMGLAAGFLAYQWEKDGTVISGATGNEFVASQPGVYRARFSRISRSPSSTQWEKWSPPVTITAGSTVTPQIIPLTTTHLRGPDNAEPNTITLQASVKADKYYWYKNGALINIANNNLDDTVSIFSITSTSTTNNGAYTLKTSTMSGCMSPVSDAINLFFNNSAPFLADSNVPGSFRVVSVTGSTASLAWQDRSTIETAYEIWRRAPGETFKMVGRTAPNTQAFTDGGLLPSTTYDYKVRALNNSGRTKYAPGDDVNTNLVVTTQNDSNAPTAPTNLKVVRNTTSSISLSWTASTDNNGSIKHYVVYYGAQSKVTNSSEPSYTLTGLPINTSYNITVKAVDNADLYSPASNQVTGTTSVKGLWYGHSTGAWTDLDQITNWDDPEFTGWVPNFTLAPRTQEEYFNFEFTGYLYIHNAGNYYFYLNSDDGSRIYIDGLQVLDFDGVHGTSGANEGFGVKSAAISLSAGPHAIRVIFFENITGQFLSVGYEGADTDNLKMLVPDAALTSGEPAGANKPPVVNITSPQNNQQFAAPANVSIAATASDTDGNVAKVEFYNGATKLGEDLTSPYAFAWNNVSAGSYTLTAKAIDNDGAIASTSVSILVTSGAGCAGAGKIQQELWTGVSGTMISSIPVTQNPASVTDLTIFEGPANIGDNYGRRIRGYICPPVSGAYIFWISSNDNSELWLSTDANPANKRKIGSVSGYTNPRQWDKYTSQQSGSITLAANQRYYIEALHKEGVGTDHVAVGWQLPGGAQEMPIPGIRLIPFNDSGSNPVPVVSITSPTDGATYTAPASVSIAANASVSSGSIVKVEFFNGSTKLGEDLSAPYAFTWSNVAAGNYTLTAKATDSGGGSATASVDISVSGSGSCAGSGTILREVWTGIPNNDVAMIPVNDPPDGVTELTIFEDPTNVGDNYGTRVSGYICVPVTGAYTFWISSNDNSELWLSTDANPSNRRRIASVTGYTNVREWTKYASQMSSAINLVAGQRYYIEALHKEGVGSDHMAVGWQLPNGTLERPIPGSRLVPFESQAMTANAFSSETNMMQVDAASTEGENLLMSAETTDATLEIFPNPAPSGVTELNISGPQSEDGVYAATVEIRRMTGEVVYATSISCEGDCAGYSIPVDRHLAAGVYLVDVVANGQRTSKRLLVK